MNIADLGVVARRRKLDWLLVCNEANVMALTGVPCDNAIVAFDAARARCTFYTDFRYIPAARRLLPKGIRVADIRRFSVSGRRVGVEFSLPHSRIIEFQKSSPRSKLVDVAKNLSDLRAVKTPEEIARIRAAEKLDCEIWRDASATFRAGQTEREMAAVIRKMMIDRGEGEAFDTIVCVGKNAAECHHVPDDTVWNGREPVLVDMGVKLGGVCSDLTRNLVPKRPRPLYRQVYDLVLKANRAAIAAAKPGMTGRALDRVARDIIREGGFGKCFGHSLGHGVGYEVHESPTASKKGKSVLKPGMLVTIEPGIYLEDNLGVRIEDLILITETGCEVLSE